MAKFGRFTGSIDVAKEEYEGDYMMHNANSDYVHILHKSDRDNTGDYLVAVISLEKGESIRKIG
jgi:hypothetical protein